VQGAQQGTFIRVIPGPRGGTRNDGLRENDFDL
jgi:hypothetical protein